ncbi:unnamed protein product [Trichogramma brassicae]|uniref:Uncharacterized protein n=1 Tax=Trichogramma brassicae TaxID=86971 RepID=A0A6H5HZI5_9HYME|nr:unnamed protein product [Trichogramma brassicae]
MFEYGPVTWFITLSPSEWMWQNRHRHIYTKITVQYQTQSPAFANSKTPNPTTRDPQKMFASILIETAEQHPQGICKESVRISEWNRRISLKGQITELERVVNDRTDQSEPLSHTELASAKARLDRIKVLFESYEELHDELAVLDGAGEENIADFEPIQTRYYNLIGKCELLFPSASTVRNSLNTTSIVSGDKTHRLKLPVADLPKFNGDVTKWLSFKNSFTAMVGTNDISKLQKVMYLQICLQDDALQKISIYNVSEENYESA